MKRAVLGALAAFVWLAALAASYTVIHNPLASGSAPAIARMLVDVTAVVAMVALAGALGRLALHSLPFASEVEQTILQALIGLALISLAVLVIGLLGLFPATWLAWAITLAGLGMLWRQAYDWARGCWAGLTRILTGGEDNFTCAVRLGVLILLGLAFILALAPPTKWDALVYHLAGPDLYLRMGRIVSAPTNHFLGFPQLVEMLYLWLLILARPQAAAVLHWLFGVLLLGLLVGFAARQFSPRVGWAAAAILLVSDSLWGEFHWAYNDLAAMAYVLAAVVSILEWGRGEVRQTLLQGGVFIGLAMGTKYTTAGAAIGIGVLTLWLTRRGGLKRMLAAGGMVAIMALLVFSPWLFKNWMLDGNPVSPFFFGTAAYDRFDQWYYLRPGTGLDLASLLLVPIQGTVFGLEMRSPYGASTGGLLVAMLPLGAVGWHEREMVQRSIVLCLVIISLPAYLFWLGGAAISWFLVQTRLLFPIFPVLALVGSWGLEGWRDVAPLENLGRLIRLIIVVILAIAVFSSGLTVIRVNPLQIVLGLQPEESYLGEQLQAYYFAMQEIGRLPDESRVLLLWEPRTFYCAGRCIPDSLINQWWHDRQLEPDPLSIAHRWHDEGFTHVLVFEAGMRFLVEEEPHEPLTADDLAALDRLRTEALTIVWEGGDAYTLYALQAGGQ